MVGIAIPSQNMIVAQGTPLVREKVTSGTTIKPGLLVKYSAADVVVVSTAGATAPIGWAGYEHCASAYRPASITTAYASGDVIPVLYGGHFVIMARLANGQNLTEGALLISGALGVVTAASNISASISETGSSSHVTPTVTVSNSIPPGGLIVGAMAANKDASGGEAWCLVHSFI